MLPEMPPPRPAPLGEQDLLATEQVVQTLLTVPTPQNQRFASILLRLIFEVRWLWSREAETKKSLDEINASLDEILDEFEEYRRLHPAQGEVKSEASPPDAQ